MKAQNEKFLASTQANLEIQSTLLQSRSVQLQNGGRTKCSGKVSLPSISKEQCNLVTLVDDEKEVIFVQEKDIESEVVPSSINPPPISPPVIIFLSPSPNPQRFPNVVCIKSKLERHGILTLTPESFKLLKGTLLPKMRDPESIHIPQRIAASSTRDMRH